MPSRIRDMPCSDAARLFRRSESWRWWLEPRWGSSYEHGCAADAFPIFSESLANRSCLFSMSQYYAHRGKEFLLCVSGPASSKTPGPLCCVCLYAAMR